METGCKVRLLFLLGLVVVVVVVVVAVVVVVEVVSRLMEMIQNRNILKKSIKIDYSRSCYVHMAILTSYLNYNFNIAIKFSNFRNIS